MISLKSNNLFNYYSVGIDVQKTKSSIISFNAKYSDSEKIALKKYYETINAIAKSILNDLTRWKGNNAGIIDVNYDEIPFDGSIGLRMYNGNPCYLMTPLGRLSIKGNGENPHYSSKQKFAELKEKFGLIEIIQKKFSVAGEQGPIFAITKDIQGNSIPELKPKGLSADFYGNPSSSPKENAMIYNQVKPKTSLFKA